jgi:hypothetical protein
VWEDWRVAVRVLTLFLAAMAVAGVSGVQDAFGCSCVPRSAQQVIDGADAAFTGTVVEVRDAPGTTSDGNPDQPIDIRFRVETVYKGELGEEVVVRTSTSGGTCGLGELEPGTRQSLGLQGDEGLWSSSICDTFDPSEVPVPLQPAGLVELARPSPISGWRNVAVWSAFDDAVGAYRLMIADGDAVGPLPVEPSPVPFDADVGPDSSGDPAIVYSRCRYAPSPPEERSIAACDLFIFGLRDDRGERPISNANSAGSEFNPTLWRGEVAWVRTYEGNPDEPFVYTRQLVAPRERRSERASGVPHKPTGVVRVEELELYGRNLALDATSNPNDSGGGTANELRLFDLHDDTSRRVARVEGALSGRDYVGVSMDAGRVAWHLTCRGDPAGCVDEGGAFRHRISTDDVERVRDATELAGFAWTLGGSYRVTGQEPSVLRTGPLDWRPIDADRVR